MIQMIEQTLSLLLEMYRDLGPGFLLAMSLPLLLGALFVVGRALRDRLQD